MTQEEKLQKVDISTYPDKLAEEINYSSRIDNAIYDIIYALNHNKIKINEISMVFDKAQKSIYESVVPLHIT